ncbi:putative RNA-directed DNA polymerase [Tanacetum coccineum]
MVEGEKPPKDKGQASSSEEDKIDQYDPLFLHSNDTSGVPLINFKLEGTENYKVWKAALTIAIHTKNKLGFINGKLVRPSEEGFMQEQWDRCNSVVLNWILGCVSQDVFMGQVFSKNAKVVWDELEETYSKQDGSVIFNMHYKIHSLSQSGSSLSEYYHKFNALWRQYDSLVNLPECVCENSDKLKEHNQLIKLMQFLMGLDEVYAPIRSIILTSDPLPDVRGAFATLSRDESQRGSQSSSTSKTGNSAFVARPNTRNTSNWNNNNNNNQSRGSKDHSTSNSFTDDQFKKLMALISDKSGSSSMPANIAVSDLNMTVGHPNDTKAMVTHMGSLRLTDHIVIHDVLVVPGYEVSLLSVHKLSKDNKFRVIFDDNTCVIQDSVQRTQVGTGSESNGLYFLNTGKRLVNNNIEVCCLSKCIWHNRLGHPADQVLSILKTKLDFEKDNTDNVCDVCHKAKQTREPFPLSEHKSKALGQLVHLDVWGPYKVQSKEGYKYFLTVVDDFTRVVWVFLLKGKDEVFHHIVIFYNLVKNQFDKTIKVFRSDNGTEFINQNMDKFCKEKGILHQTSCPYTPQQNGVAERKHRHLLNVGRALMFQGGIPLNMWTECILTAVYLINRLPSSVLSGKSPYELVFNREPSLSHLKTFGCLCFSTVLNDSDKFSSRSEKSVFIGYSNDKKGYKLFSLENKKVFYSRDVKFYETVFPFKNSSVCKEYQMVFGDKNSLNFFNCDEDESKSSEPYDDRRDKESEIGKGTYHMSSGGTENTGNTRRDEGGHPYDSEPAEVVSDIEESETLIESDKESEGDDSFYQEFNEMFEIPSVIPDSQSEVNLRRSSRKTSVPKKFSDFKLDSKVKYSIDKHVNYSSLSVENFNFSTNLNKIVEPKTFDEASKDIRWIEAMNLEMEALNRNGTWVITELPVGRKPIGNKWVWKVKYKSTGDVERFKARLVAKGYNQKEGIDYDETFSPVVKIVTVRCILSLAVFNNWSVYQLDINNAFMYGDMEEDVYMSLPEGYFAKDDKRVCKLVKSLYGLKQAPRKWNEKLTSVLLENEFTQSKSDFSLFTKSKNGIVIVLLVYVDDIVITGNNSDEIDKFKKFLSSKFMIKDLGKLKYFLGIEVLENNGGLVLTQRKYCLELLTEFGMLACKPCGTPIESRECVIKPYKGKVLDIDYPLTGINNYQKLVGKLIYLTHTRPDISYVVHVLSQFMHAPLQSHLKLAFRVLRYLKTTPGKGISFNKGSDLNLRVYVDSDWAKCKVTRKSVTGAMKGVTCEVMWILKILAELKVNTSLPVPLHCDNSSAIQVAANPVFHERTKHFEIELFFLREKVANGIVKTVKIKSADNSADIFTKGLSVVDHNKFCEYLGLTDLYRIGLRGNIENIKPNPVLRTNDERTGKSNPANSSQMSQHQQPNYQISALALYGKINFLKAKALRFRFFTLSRTRNDPEDFFIQLCLRSCCKSVHDEDDDEDDTRALMAELDQIIKEMAEEKLRKASFSPYAVYGAFLSFHFLFSQFQ